MADEEDKKNPEESDDAFKFPSESFETGSDGDEDEGSLPPLSDFESTEDSSGSGEGGDDFGSLPPLSDIDVNTPGSSGDEGGAASSPPGFDSGAAFNTPASDGDIDTPTPGGELDTPQDAGQTAFQDLQADSDFSPETPEIGPGPDSDLETPMFDSAFGGGASDLTPPPPSATDTPTMAMDTPMFDSSSSGSDSSGGDFGFDDDAFGGGASSGGDFGTGGGTPVPDMTDTGFPGGATPTAAPSPFDNTATPPPTPPVEGGAPAKGGSSTMTVIIAAVLALIIGVAGGIFGGPMLGFGGGGDPDIIAQKDQQIQSLNSRIQSLEQTMTRGQDSVGKTPQELQADIERLLGEISVQESRLEEINSQTAESQSAYEAVQQDLDEANQQFLDASNELQDAQNAMSITRAQQEGLKAEIDRFQDLVGELEEANARRLQTRDSLRASIGRLEALVKEGSPLAPAKYNRNERIARVEDLKNRVQSARWVSAQLLDEYTALYLDELQIAASREYFFAQIPVEDKLGTVELKWAECVMNGNWSVFFRTLDGKSVGIYQNVSSGGPADYEFRQFLDSAVEENVEEEIFAARPADWQDKIAIIAERQVATDGRHQMQKWYDSL